MNSRVMGCIFFVLGLAIGSITTAQYVRKKYENIVQEEVDSIKEVLLKKTNRPAKDTKESKEKSEADLKKYKDLIEIRKYVNDSEKLFDEPTQSYTDYDERLNLMSAAEVTATIRPYVISPEKFGEIEEYEQCTLLYYLDHVLVYEDGDLVDAVDAIIGEDSLDHFGEYEDDSVFVRNDSMKCDYEILLEPRNFYSDD